MPSDLKIEKKKGIYKYYKINSLISSHHRQKMGQKTQKVHILAKPNVGWG